MRKKYIAGGVIICSITLIANLVVQHNPDIRTGQQGLEIIGNAEGCSRYPYQCPANVLTVGIGSTEAGGARIRRNKIYTDKEIAERWADDLRAAEKCVNNYGNGRNMPQGAFEAMTSIAFNVGCGSIKNSTLFKMARNGYSPQMCDQFLRWVYAGGSKLRGLEVRREQERRLCLQK